MVLYGRKVYLYFHGGTHGSLCPYIAGTVSGNNGTAAKGHDAETITSTETLEKIKKPERIFSILSGFLCLTLIFCIVYVQRFY